MSVPEKCMCIKIWKSTHFESESFEKVFSKNISFAKCKMLLSSDLFMEIL